MQSMASAKSPKYPISNVTAWVTIVDDEFDIVSTFKQGLEKKGFHTFGFTEPTLALEHFRLNQEKYDLLISDLRMPGMNGFEFIKQVKEIRPEVFLMTAFEINDAEFRNALPNVETEGLIQKPISLANLTGTVSKYINHHLPSRSIDTYLNDS